MGKRNITLDDLFKIKVVSGMSVSPDGTQIAFAMKRTDFKANKVYSSIYAVSTRGGHVRRLTHGDHADAAPQWSPDGRCIGFLSDREKASCIWLLPMDGGEPRRLTDRDGDVSEFTFSPDGGHVAFIYRPKSDRQKLERDEKKDDLAKRPQYKHVTRLWYKTDGVGFWNGHYAHVWRIGVGGGRAVRMTGGDYDDYAPRYSPDGKHLAFLSNRTPDPDKETANRDIYTMPARGGRATKVSRQLGAILAYSWSPDGKRFAYLGFHGPSRDSMKHNVGTWVVDRTGNNARCISKEIDNHCFNITISDVSEITFAGDPPIWAPDGSRVYASVSERGACHLYELPVSSRSSPRVRVDGELVVCNAQRSTPGGPVALLIADVHNPGDIHVFDPENGDGRLRRVTHVNQTLLKSLRLATPEPVACRRGKYTVHGWLLKPPAFRSTRKYPLLLQIHGGPMTQYGHVFFHELQWLAASGHAVLYTNPRGSIGYGLDYCRELFGQWGSADYPDLMACVDQVVREKFIDGRRLYVTGGSYGGFMTNWIVSHTHRFRAAVTQRCVSSMESLAGASDFGWDLAWMLGAMPWEAPKHFRRQSPLTYLPKCKTPLLIIHSEQDLRCPIDQAEQVFSMLKYLQRDVEFLRFEGESHGLSRAGRPQNRAERLRRILDWFQRHA